jgi:HSP20 family protein
LFKNLGDIKMTLVKYNPYRGLGSLNRKMNSLINNFESGSSFEKTDFMPKVDISENDKQMVIHAEIPGISKEDIKITVDSDNILSLKGTKKRELKESNESGGINYHRIERSYGEFSRSFILPDYVNPDSIQAKFENGVITINLEKTEPKQPKEIVINVN